VDVFWDVWAGNFSKVNKSAGRYNKAFFMQESFAWGKRQGRAGEGCKGAPDKTNALKFGSKI
jgi:hypothetical protein